MDKILSYKDYGKASRYDCDVVVVGTGAGGAVVGAELAEAGLDVILVEEGSWVPTSSFNPYLTESIPRLYRDAGTTSVLGTPNIPYLEGRAVGGSTTINGGMAYRAPERVLEEWQRLTGEPGLGPAGMDALFGEVERRISARHQEPESIGDDNRLMALGAKKLGWHSETNRRNQDACVGTNNCVFGCPTGAKQSTLVTYMPRAMAAGARCLTELRVESLRVDGGRCTGVVGRSPDPATRRYGRQVTISARAVVVACGAIHTPHLLMGHRLGKTSRQLGKHLLLHPNAKVIAVYPFDVFAWKGVSQWTQVREFHRDGVLFAENMIPPSPMGASLPWHGDESLRMLERYNQMACTGVLVEDSTSGSVERTILGMPLARYDITDWDFERFLTGIERLSELHFAMGAEMVLLPFRAAPRAFGARARSADDLHLARSMDEVRGVLRGGLKKQQIELFTVHLMGTARMGARPAASVVDLEGQLWDLPGCYVADASIFPTAIGVNPQVTIMALATRIARRLAERWSRGRARASSREASPAA
ncbi:MAG: GMC family oxidoreductase [Deltaproteobacteria bacterium]|nr:GMC family oxidoreductase [Deltaproteobacteria bacterium]